jgi:hypothetical protein
MGAAASADARGANAPIGLERGEEVRAAMQSRVKGAIDDYYPPVLVSYATGSRQGVDAPGCGPGMLYAQAVVDELGKAGLGSFTGLHVGAGVDWHVFVEKLSGRFSECKALVVVVTPALYQSRACLAEISAALDAGVRVVPVLFENPIPTAREQWPMIDKHDSDGKLMLLKVQKDFARLNTVPAPPGDIRSQPQAIGRVVGVVASVAGGAAAGAQQYFEQGARSQEGIEHRRWQPAPAVAAAAALAAVVPPAAAAAAAGAVGVDGVAGGGGGEGERAPWARAAILGARR